MVSADFCTGQLPLGMFLMPPQPGPWPRRAQRLRPAGGRLDNQPPAATPRGRARAVGGGGGGGRRGGRLAHRGAGRCGPPRRGLAWLTVASSWFWTDAKQDSD